MPTSSPESDGTIGWNKTTMVLVEVEGGGERGLGYTYSSAAAATLIRETLRELVVGADAMNVSDCWLRMCHAVRNIGIEGIASMAISAVDNALWDLKAKLLGLPLVRLLGQVRDRAPVYGSGGFTSYTLEQLSDQLSGWAAEGMGRVKMKIGTSPQEDVVRVRAARQAIGTDVALFVDANGAYHPRQALGVAHRMAALGVAWFEEPVDHHDLEGLRTVKAGAPPGMDVSAGEYGWASLEYFQRLLPAVDILQADATRCGGFSGFLRVAALCDTHLVPLSSHCAPSLHVHVACAALPFCHIEYFYDHVRIEKMFFDGVLPAVSGYLAPDLSRPGLGLEFKRQDAERYASQKESRPCP